MKKTLAGLAALTIAAGCQTATPYQPANRSGDGGYLDQRIESDRWAISFSGNSATDRQTVETYLLFRAAELTLQNGFEHFQIVARDTDAETRFVSNGFGSPFFYNFYGTGFPRRGFGRGFHGSGFFFAGSGFHDPFLFDSGFTVQELTRFEAVAEIIMGEGKKPAGAAFFNAGEVLLNLSGSIEFPKQ